MQNILLCFAKLIKYIFSAVSECSNPCVGPLPKIKISFFLLSICTKALISTPKVITFLPNPISRNEKFPCLSNPIPYPEYLYLSKSAFLVKITEQINNFLVSDNR